MGSVVDERQLSSERYANLRQQAKFADPQPGGYHVWLEAVEERA